VILDNHSAHISKETKAWLALRHIRVTSKKELQDRIMAAIDDINLNPVVHTWTYKLDSA
jgi:hypothetical protein